MSRLLSLKNNHVFICGITRSGKTFFAAHALAEIKLPALFFNVQDEKLPAPFLRLTPKDDISDVMRLLKKGCKIDFRFGDLSGALIQEVIAYILDKLMISHSFNQEHPVYIAIDEAQILSDEALRSAIDISTRGLARGIRLVAITQRPALCNKTIYTQAAEQYIFRLAPSEREYIKNKGLDFDSCTELWRKNGDYSYIFTDGYEITGHAALKSPG